MTLSRNQAKSELEALMPRLQKAFTYATSGLPDNIETASWKDFQDASAVTLPIMAGTFLPNIPGFMYSPFLMSSPFQGLTSQIADTSRNTFLWESEKALKNVGFQVPSAKFLSYLRLLLVEHGCSASTRPDGSERFESVMCSFRTPQLDENALSRANLVWPILTLTGVAAYFDSQNVLDVRTCTLAASYWAVTPWRNMLKAYEISWWHIYLYVLKPFHISELLTAISVSILKGTATHVPILDVVEDAVSSTGFYGMMPIWGTEGGKAWWATIASVGTHLIKEKRAELAETIGFFPEGAIPMDIKLWIEADIPPFLDVVRVLMPIVKEAIRPIYMPEGIVKLASNPGFDPAQLVIHATRFAETLVEQGFSASSLIGKGLIIADIAHPQFSKLWENVASVPSFIASVKVKPERPRFHVLSITGGSSSELEPTHESSTQNQVEEITEQLRGLDLEASARIEALTDAWACITFEKYGESEFETYVSAKDKPKQVSRLWTPELHKARQVFQSSMESKGF